MRHTGLFLLLAAMVFTPAGNGESRGDFAGTWKMDTVRSESAHQEAPVEWSTLTIELKDTVLTFETTRSGVGAPAPFHEKLTLKLDGSETKGVGDGDVEVTGKARWDGNKLVVETIRNIHDSTVTTLYVHKLSADGREMTVDKTLTIQHGYQGSSAPTSGHGKDVFIRRKA